MRNTNSIFTSSIVKNSYLPKSQRHYSFASPVPTVCQRLLFAGFPISPRTYACCMNGVRERPYHNLRLFKISCAIFL
jgi:hypothetical protein